MLANDGTVSIGTELDNSGFKKGLSRLGGIASGAVKGITAGIGAASAAVGLLAKQSLDAYAAQEQLAGGVETLFKDSADTVKEYAANAYKTAGLSANAYMETVTSFSASLLQGLGGDTEKAAQVADVAITDMADNANKMGTSIGMIQNAYQGFAKQNYTMLDNLKLGYGGTQAEMARLINDSGVLGDTMTVTAETVNQVSFDKIIEAIHVVQDRMGIAGATAQEASSTIEGSVNAMKGAWENLVAGMGDENADLDTLINNFVDSVSVAAENIVPRLEQILIGFGEVVGKLAPILAEKLPAIISNVLPNMITAGAQLVVALVQGLVGALPAIIEVLPDIVKAIYDGIVAVGPQLLEAGGQLLKMLADGIVTAVPKVIEALPSIITSIIGFFQKNLPVFLEAGANFITGLLSGIVAAIPSLVEGLPQVITAIVDFVVSNLPEVIRAGAEIIGALVWGIISAIPSIVTAIPDVIKAIVDGFSRLPELLFNIGVNIIQGLIDGVKSMISNVVDAIETVVDALFGGASKKAEVHSPSKRAKRLGAYIDDGLAMGLEDNAGKIEKAVDHLDVLTQLERSIPGAQRSVSLANAGMVPASSAHEPSPIAPAPVGGATGGGGRSEQTIVIRYEGDLAQLAQVLTPYIDDEHTRLGTEID